MSLQSETRCLSQVLGKLASDPLPEFSFRWLAQVHRLLDGLGPHARSPAARLVLRAALGAGDHRQVSSPGFALERMRLLLARRGSELQRRSTGGLPLATGFRLQTGCDTADTERSDVGIDRVTHLLVETEAQERIDPVRRMTAWDGQELKVIELVRWDHSVSWTRSSMRGVLPVAGRPEKKKLVPSPVTRDERSAGATIRHRCRARPRSAREYSGPPSRTSAGAER